jgi:hypothetical protein
MQENEPHTPEFDWRLTTFEGARREQLRRWAQLPLENILLAIEEMQDIAQALSTPPTGEPDESVLAASVEEPLRDRRDDGTKGVGNCDEQ